MFCHPRDLMDHVERLQRYEQLCQTHRAAVRKASLYVTICVYLIVFLITYHWILVAA